MKQFISWDEYDGYIDSIANWVSAVIKKVKEHY